MSQLSWAFRRDWEMSKDKSLNIGRTKAKCRVEEHNSNVGAAGAKPTLQAKQRQKTQDRIASWVEADKRGTTTKVQQWRWRRSVSFGLRARADRRWFGLAWKQLTTHQKKMQTEWSKSNKTSTSATEWDPCGSKSWINLALNERSCRSQKLEKTVDLVSTFVCTQKTKLN